MEKILEKFYKKIDKDHTAYFNTVEKMTGFELINHLREIAAMQEIYETLKADTSLNTDYLQYLLKFKNPLYVIHDCWVNDGQDISEALNHILWNIFDKKDAEQDYPLEENIAGSEKQGGMRMC